VLAFPEKYWVAAVAVAAVNAGRRVGSLVAGAAAAVAAVVAAVAAAAAVEVVEVVVLIEAV